MIDTQTCVIVMAEENLSKCPRAKELSLGPVSGSCHCKDGARKMVTTQRIAPLKQRTITWTAYTIIINVREDHVAVGTLLSVSLDHCLIKEPALVDKYLHLWHNCMSLHSGDILSNTCMYSTWVRSSLYMPFPAFDSQYALGYRNTCTRMKILLKIHLCWIHSAGPSSAVLVQRRWVLLSCCLC